MREQYIAPEAKLLCLAARQQLATVDFDDLLESSGQGFDNSVTPEKSDISLEIP